MIQRDGCISILQLSVETQNWINQRQLFKPQSQRNVYRNDFCTQILKVCLMGKMGLILKWEEREQIN